jgi:hypothetical protein
MRINLPAAIAAVVLSCGLSVPASATTFTFDIDHPVTITATGRTFNYTYFAKSLGAYIGSGDAQDAPFEVKIKYFDETRNEFVQNSGDRGTIPSSGKTPFIDYVNVNYGDYDGYAQFFITFQTVSDQKLLISDLEGYEYPQVGGPGSFFSFSVLPEPSTWLFMLSGFGMIGYAMRRRSIVRTTVAYG